MDRRMNKTWFRRRENQMVFRRALMPRLVLGINLAIGSTAYGLVPGIICSLSAGPTAAASGLPKLWGPTARATAIGHTEPIAAGPDGTEGSGAAGSPNPGGGTLRVTCTNQSGGTITSTSAPPGYHATGLAVAQISLG